MEKYCWNCGKKINENQNVCLNCGVFVKENTNTTDKLEKSANAGFILGLCSIIAWILPLIGYPTTICGIVFSSKGLKSTTNKGKATAGLVLSIIFLFITLINSFIGVLMWYIDFYF